MIDSSEQNNNNVPAKSYILFTQFILEVLFFVGGAIILGLKLDKLLNTKCLFLIIFLFMFAFVPIYNLVKRARIFVEDKSNGKK